MTEQPMLICLVGSFSRSSGSRGCSGRRDERERAEIEIHENYALRAARLLYNQSSGVAVSPGLLRGVLGV